MLDAPRHWYSQNLTAWSLLPVSLVFCAIAVLRRLMYRVTLLPTRSFPRPVVVVGNIAVGGTGKTPLIIAICEALKQRGLNPGIVSRGYGGAVIGPYVVDKHDDALKVGDEPILIHRRTGCPVIVAEQRARATKLMLDCYDVDVILSDDGMQHYELERDVEIAVVDANWMHGNGYCMPSGPLREPVWRLKSVDYVVYSNADGVQHRGYRLAVAGIVNLRTGREEELEDYAGKRVHAVAGIGQPSRFFNMLRDAGIDPVEHAFGDHHIYRPEDLAFDDDLPVLMTEKDAVKCDRFDDVQRYRAIRVDAVMDQALLSQIIERIGALCDE